MALCSGPAVRTPSLFGPVKTVLEVCLASPWRRDSCSNACIGLHKAVAASTVTSYSHLSMNALHSVLFKVNYDSKSVAALRWFAVTENKPDHSVCYYLVETWLFTCWMHRATQFIRSRNLAHSFKELKKLCVTSAAHSNEF